MSPFLSITTRESRTMDALCSLAAKPAPPGFASLLLRLLSECDRQSLLCRCLLQRGETRCGLNFYIQSDTQRSAFIPLFLALVKKGDLTTKLQALMLTSTCKPIQHARFRSKHARIGGTSRNVKGKNISIWKLFIKAGGKAT